MAEEQRKEDLSAALKEVIVINENLEKKIELMQMRLERYERVFRDIRELSNYT